MKEIVKNILAGLWYMRAYFLTFAGFMGYVVSLLTGHYLLAIINLVLAFVNILLYLLHEIGKNVRRKT